MKPFVLFIKVHKWIGLIVGIQVVLWIAGGLYMTWNPIEVVRGEHNMRVVEPLALNGAEGIIPVAEAIAAAGGTPVTGLSLGHFLGTPVYRLEGAEGPLAMIDARSGTLLSPLPEAQALAVAIADFTGEAKPDGANWLTEKNLEYRGSLPVWQVYLHDGEDTRLYVSPLTGRVISRRTNTWRIFDFFWMLHIMDYSERKNFNNPLVIFASAIGLLLAISGVLLLFYRFGKRDFAWLRRG
jgi:uncharacterized iron-regulated membrane protein